jgi:hypothetical protein
LGGYFFVLFKEETMANSYKTNPIVIDSVSVTVDIANLAFELTTAPVHIEKVVFSNPTANDIVILKDRKGVVKVELEAVDAGQVTQNFIPPLVCDGLQSVTGDNTITTGKVYIYV